MVTAYFSRVSHDIFEWQPALNGVPGGGARDADGGVTAEVPDHQSGPSAEDCLRALR